jgi:hypothetical protein
MFLNQKFFMFLKKGSVKIKAEKLVSDLAELTKNNLNQAEKLYQLPVQKLQWKPSAESWSSIWFRRSTCSMKYHNLSNKCS